MADNLLRGGALLVGATILFSMSDTMAKYITTTVPPVEMAAIRYAVFVALAASPLLRRRRISLRSRRPVLQVLRGIGAVGSALFFILSLGSLPIAEATAINFVTPLLITVFAIPVLGEVVTARGWLALLTGFVGVLVVVRPGLGGFHPAALLVLASASFWCLSMLITRRLVGVDRSTVTLLWTAGTGLIVLLVLLPFFAVPLSLPQALFCVATGVVASGGQWLALLAYRYARATVLAPLSYGQLIWSSALGYLVFHTVPDRWVLVGALIIAASGLAVVRIERSRVAKLAALGPAAATGPQTLSTVVVAEELGVDEGEQRLVERAAQRHVR